MFSSPSSFFKIFGVQQENGSRSEHSASLSSAESELLPEPLTFPEAMRPHAGVLARGLLLSSGLISVCFMAAVQIQEPLKPNLGTAVRFAGMVLFAWAWLKTWLELGHHLQHVLADGIAYLHYAEHSLPFAVLLTGLFAQTSWAFSTTRRPQGPAWQWLLPWTRCML